MFEQNCIIVEIAVALQIIFCSGLFYDVNILDHLESTDRLFVGWGIVRDSEGCACGLI